MKTILLFCIPLIILLVILFCYLQNNWIKITKIPYQNKKVPTEFDGFRILHVSDLHNKKFGKNQNKLIAKTKNLKPDIIIITGDLIYRRSDNYEFALEYIRQAVKIAPVYFSAGNHECKSKIYAEFKQKLIDCGVKILDDSNIDITRNSDLIRLYGIIDPKFPSKKNGIINKPLYESFYQTLLNMKKAGSARRQSRGGISNTMKKDDENHLTILLSHRPDLFSLYIKTNYDLVFCGHAHGGQIRLPFIGGLYAPDQGIFPKYTNGAYHEKKTTMIVSRGLGRSAFPLRIFNRPHLILVTFNKPNP